MNQQQFHTAKATYFAVANMHVSVRTLESQAVLTVSVDPLETIGAFKKRAAATLPYNGAMHPLPSEPIRADVDPTQSALWADLAAELRSAPISAPLDHHAEAVDQLKSAAASDLPASASGSHQAANWDQSAKRGIRAGQAAAAAGGRVKAVSRDDAPAAKPKPPRQTRCRLISNNAASEATDSANDSNLAAAKEKRTQVKKAARAPKSESRSQAAEPALASAEQNPSAAEESEAEDAGKGDPCRQAKNAAFKGSGALGLSRRLSSRLLTPQEVNIMAKLPLPPVLERLNKVLFPPVNGMYGFLLRQHIQPTWRAIKSAAANVPGGEEVQVEDVQTMADLCPDVVILRDPQQIQSPNKSIRQWRMSIQTEPAVPSLVNPIDAEDAMLVRQTSGEYTLPVSQAHPMEITTDGSGTVFGGQARRDRLIVEIMDPGRKTIGSTSLAEMGVDEDAAIQEVLSQLLVSPLYGAPQGKPDKPIQAQPQH
ncbi:MAG: hypothetical protein FRX49_07760 [Trebouxia sp. A1-2]|nr:MAG: hypothetical protein FRX49_07760 [Trebouxia sp. A1-2]